MNFIYLVVSGSWWQLSQQIAHTQQETATVTRAAAPPTSQENRINPSRFLEKLWALEKDKSAL